MVHSFLLVTSLNIINVLMNDLQILLLIFFFLLFKIMNLLIYSDRISLITGSAKDHLLETSYYKKNMSIKFDNQRTSISTCLFNGMLFFSKL